MNLDLGDFESVKAFSQKIINTYDKVDILLNNAGLSGAPLRTTQKQGFENTVGVNHLGHFLLTQNLLPLLKKSEDGRIVNVASAAYAFNQIDINDIQQEQSYQPYKAYSNSKLMQIFTTQKLAQKLELDGFTNLKVVSLHPGTLRTEFFRDFFKNKCQMYICVAMNWPCIYACMKSPTMGAQTSLHCCLANKDELENGAYHLNCAKYKFYPKGDHE